MVDMPEGLWEKVFIKHILVYHEYLTLHREFKKLQGHRNLQHHFLKRKCSVLVSLRFL